MGGFHVTLESPLDEVYMATTSIEILSFSVTVVLFFNGEVATNLQNY